jgi:hypothetical protein
MHRIRPLFLFLVAAAGFIPSVCAQEKQSESKEDAHRLSLGLGHTQLSGTFSDDGVQSIPLASWSLDYDYGLSLHWGVGLQLEWLLQSFVIEGKDGAADIERAYPLSIVPAGLYHLDEHWTLIGGVGGEVSEGEFLALTRLGIEWGWEVSPQWEFGAALVWDDKWNYYNSYGIAFTVSRLWRNAP